MIIPPRLKDQIGHLASQEGSLRETHAQARQRDLEEQERKDRARLRYQDNSPSPRQLTAKDISDFEKAEEFHGLQELARAARRQDRLVEKIEGLMNRDFNTYANSIWPETYARLTGADREAKEKSR